MSKVLIINASGWMANDRMAELLETAKVEVDFEHRLESVAKRIGRGNYDLAIFFGDGERFVSELNDPSFPAKTKIIYFMGTMDKPGIVVPEFVYVIVHDLETVTDLFYKVMEVLK